MSIEIKPIGDACNLNCEYCYEHPIREANEKPKLDFNVIRKALECAGGSFTVFGGEPLLVGYEALEEFFKIGLEKWGKNSIQTNALLVDLELAELFKKYKVHVGISFDGPDELNNARCPLTLTKKIEAKIDLLLALEIIPSFIVTITKYNCRGKNLAKLVEWFKYLDFRGVTSVRIHNLQDNGRCASIVPTAQENFDAFTYIYENTRILQNIQFDVFKDIQDALAGNVAHLTCIWNGCDPYNTRAVYGIQANGQVENCGRVYKDGTIWLKSDCPDDVRGGILERTPYNEGGCKGCRFFPICKGQCPGTAIEGDWRNRTADCEFWKMMFEYFETPESVTQKPRPEVKVAGGTHGDSPHIDAHGDHTDKVMIQVPVLRK